MHSKVLVVSDQAFECFEIVFCNFDSDTAVLHFLSRYVLRFVLRNMGKYVCFFNHGESFY